MFLSVKAIIIGLLMLSLAACSGHVDRAAQLPKKPAPIVQQLESLTSINHVRVGAGDIADAASTAVGLSQGFVEANPLFSGAGSAAPVVGLVSKVLFKKLLVLTGSTPAQANIIVETGGWVGGCANFVTVAAKAKPVVAIVVGLTCGVIAHRQLVKQALAAQ